MDDAVRIAERFAEIHQEISNAQMQWARHRDPEGAERIIDDLHKKIYRLQDSLMDTVVSQ
jgi:hypothetical protein